MKVTTYEEVQNTLKGRWTKRQITFENQKNIVKVIKMEKNKNGHYIFANVFTTHKNITTKVELYESLVTILTDNWFKSKSVEKKNITNNSLDLELENKPLSNSTKKKTKKQQLQELIDGCPLNNCKDKNVKTFLSTTINRFQKNIDDLDSNNDFKISLLKGFNCLLNKKDILKEITSINISRARKYKTFFFQSEEEEYIAQITEKCSFDEVIEMTEALKYISNMPIKEIHPGLNYIFRLKIGEFWYQSPTQTIELDSLRKLEQKIQSLRSESGFGSFIILEKVKIYEGWVSTFGETIKYYSSTGFIKHLLQKELFRYHLTLMSKLELLPEENVEITIDRNTYSVGTWKQILNLIKTKKMNEIYQSIISKLDWQLSKENNIEYNII